MRPLKVIPLLVLASTLVFAKHPKIAQDLDNADPSAMVDVIIQFNTPPTDADHQKIHDRGGSQKKSLDLVKGSLYSVPVSALKALADDPDVAYIAPDRPVNAAMDTSAAAVNAAPAGKPALSPTVQLDSKTHKVTLVLGANLVWGDSLFWVSRALHGFSIV